jgi:glycosyltransferase involved in cell wall biosynthesis/GT2 family glycosyltransferase
VNGPSTDHTNAVLDDLEKREIQFKRASCSSRNLSKSRNVGIGHAAGDVIFFIDDDAVAHREWVARLIRCYIDECVGGAGGFTFDHTGVSYQCRYTVCDKFGNARYFNTVDPQALLLSSTDFFFPSLLGTNSSFSRDALEQIGGFDEVFEYMLDETDVCARIVDRKLKIITIPDAYVFHKYAPSETRTHERLPRSLLAPARSKSYFCLKHSSTDENSVLHLGAMTEIDRYRKDIEFSNKWFLDHKKITPSHYTKISRELTDGISEGLQLGFGISQNSASLNPAPKPNLPFINVSKPRGSEAQSLRIYFVSQGYPPNDTSGIARWTHECALELSERGNEVHVITRSQTKANHLDFKDGVWIHSVVDVFSDDLVYSSPIPIPESIARRAEAVLREIKRSQPIWGVDVVSAPIWDVEGILCCAHLKVPVITSLHTTYKLALPFKPEWSNDRQYRTKHVDKVIAAETWLLEHSVAVLANSQQIISEIDHCYADVLKHRTGNVTTVLHGLGSPIPQTLNGHHRITSLERGEKVRILFVGRLEERKGPDQLLLALARISGLLDRIEVIFVGSPGKSDDPYTAKIKQLADSLKRKNARAAVNFIGHVSDADLARYYSECDIFVAPSRFESFGLVLIEAMRHGVPVIACDVGGMREIITNGVDGYLFKVDDVGELASRLRFLIEEHEARKSIGRSAKATYEDRFTSVKMAEAIETMLCSVTKEFADERI